MTSNPTTPARVATSEAETIATLMRELTAQLAAAHGRIQELEGLLGGAVKELEMYDKIAELKIQHAVLVAQIEWNAQWQQLEALASSDKSPAAMQPAAPAAELPAAKLAASKASSTAPPAAEPGAGEPSSLVSVPAKEDLLPDPWKPAALSPPGIAKQDEDAGEPVRPPHPKWRP